MKKITFIVNPISGAFKKGHIRPLIQERLDKRKFEHDVVFTEYAGHAVELSKELAQKGTDVVVAVGGDGSVNEVARGLVHSETQLGVLPSGSGNGFAMSLGMGRRIKKALDIINTGQPQWIDTIALNGEPFINLSGIGFDAKIAYDFKGSKLRGFLNYLRITMEQAVKFPFSDYTFQIDDGHPFDRECLLIVVANGTSFGYNFQAAPLAEINDGLIELVIVNKRNKLKYFSDAHKMINGKIHTSEYYERHTCKNVKIIIPKDSYVHVDGEGFQTSEVLDYKIVPKSLRLILPR